MRGAPSLPGQVAQSCPCRSLPAATAMSQPLSSCPKVSVQEGAEVRVRIIGYPGLEGSHRDHQLQFLALHRLPNNLTMCLRVVSSHCCWWSVLVVMPHREMLLGACCALLFLSQNRLPWKSPPRTSSPTTNAALPNPPLNHLSKCHIQIFF